MEKSTALIAEPVKFQKVAAAKHSRNEPGRVSYLENKLPDQQRVSELLSLSAAANRWANGGPVSKLLEERIAEITGLHSGRAVVVCASGTSALNVLAQLYAFKQGRPLRWAVSAYSFFSCFIGPFAGSLTVDCDDEGMLNLEALAALPSESYDGVCVTNLFGLHPDLRRYEEFCRERKKILIVDNAQGFFGVERSRPDSPDEIISLHHTKPWGFGEGGCILVSKEDESTTRSLINFGVSLPRTAAPFVFNGKMADVAAAYILNRLERIPDWLPRYEKEWSRLIEIAGNYSLVAFPRSAERFAGIGHVPFLAARPVTMEELENDFLVIRKYYRPPTDLHLVKARQLFARIVNVPCHSDMAGLSTKAIRQIFGKLFPAVN